MRGPFSTPITPLPGSFFHADPHDEITYQSLSWLCRCITPNVLSHDMEESRASDAHRTTILPFMP
ncbi:hypothetical protein DAH85_23125, partial [Sphingomonas koreensis]